MKGRTPVWLLGSLAAALVVAGLAMTIRSATRMDDVSAQLSGKLHELESLRAMAVEVGEFHAARQAFEQLPAPHVPPLGDLIRRVMPDRKPDGLREVNRESVSGWMVSRMEVSFNEIPVSVAMELIREAETQRPPWYLVKCAIRASSQTPGTGSVVLHFEGISREE